MLIPSGHPLRKHSPESLREPSSVEEGHKWKKSMLYSISEFGPWGELPVCVFFFVMLAKSSGGFGRELTYYWNGTNDSRRMKARL